MSVSPTGIVPERLMYRQKRKAMREWLIEQPYTKVFKRDLYFGWAKTVGVRLTESEVSEVENSGIEAYNP